MQVKDIEIDDELEINRAGEEVLTIFITDCNSDAWEEITKADAIEIIDHISRVFKLDT